MPANIGEAVFEIRGENAKLKAALAESARVVSTRSAQMANSLQKTSKATVQTADKLNVLEKAAAATGIGAIAMAKSWTELGLALQKVGAAIKAFMLQPVVKMTLALTGVGVIIAALLSAILLKNQLALALEKKNIEAAKERLKVIEDRWKTILKERATAIAGYRERMALLRGEIKETDKLAPAVRKVALEYEALKAKMERIAEIRARQAARGEEFRRRELQRQADIKAAIAAEQRQIDLLRGRRSLLDDINDRELKSITYRRTQLQQEQALKAAAASRLKTAQAENQALRGRLGLQSPFQIMRGLKMDIGQMLGSQYLQEMRRRLVGLLPADLQGPAKKMLGVSPRGSAGMMALTKSTSPDAISALAAAGGASLAVETPETVQLKKIHTLLEKLFWELRSPTMAVGGLRP